MLFIKKSGTIQEKNVFRSFLYTIHINPTNLFRSKYRQSLTSFMRKDFLSQETYKPF